MTFLPPAPCCNPKCPWNADRGGAEFWGSFWAAENCSAILPFAETPWWISIPVNVEPEGDGLCRRAFTVTRTSVQCHALKKKSKFALFSNHASNLCSLLKHFIKIYEELSSERLDPITVALLLKHPFIQDLVNTYKDYKLPVSTLFPAGAHNFGVFSKNNTKIKCYGASVAFPMY